MVASFMEVMITHDGIVRVSNDVNDSVEATEMHLRIRKVTQGGHWEMRLYEKSVGFVAFRAECGSKFFVAVQGGSEVSGGFLQQGSDP